MDGDLLVNGEVQKRASDIVAEADIALQLSRLRNAPGGHDYFTIGIMMLVKSRSGRRTSWRRWTSCCGCPACATRRVRAWVLLYSWGSLAESARAGPLPCWRQSHKVLCEPSREVIATVESQVTLLTSHVLVATGEPQAAYATAGFLNTRSVGVCRGSLP